MNPVALAHWGLRTLYLCWMNLAVYFLEPASELEKGGSGSIVAQVDRLLVLLIHLCGRV